MKVQKVTPALAAKIKATRMQKDISMRAMGELVGLSASTIAYIESGEAKDSSALPLILNALGLNEESAGPSTTAKPRDALRAALDFRAHAKALIPSDSLVEAQDCATPAGEAWRLAEPLGRWAPGEILLIDKISSSADWAAGDELLLWHSNGTVELVVGLYQKADIITVQRGDRASSVLLPQILAHGRLTGAIFPR